MLRVRNRSPLHRLPAMSVEGAGFKLKDLTEELLMSTIIRCI